MKATTRWTLVLVAGLLLLILPTALRMVREQGGAPPAAGPSAGYTPPAIATPALAATPIPTSTPMSSRETTALATADLPRGPVVVDLAHYSLIERSKFQPLAAALAGHGLDLRFWLPSVDMTDIQQLTDFPDLEADLEKQVAGASALVVISPYFLYTPAEVGVVERFVADGGRLLLISDPDVESDSASDTNHLATAFNVIFNQDYLYDTVANDANFTYFFQGEYVNEARALAGSRIAFYGGRSIGGAVAPQVRSADTTLSSLRNGLTSFNTVVLGGAPANGSAGRVLAMSDFDVLTDPYVARHDNRLMLEFVGDFLAGAVRDNGLADFPDFLGKEVALRLDETQPVGALALTKAAELQRMLEASGRQLRLAPAEALSSTQPGPDLIYVGSYGGLTGERGLPAGLLAGLDLRLVEEVVMPTVSAAGPPVIAGGTPEQATGGGGLLPAEGEQPEHKGTPLAPVAPPEVPPLGTPQPEPLPQATPELTPELTVELTPPAAPTADSRAGSGTPVHGQADTPTATATEPATATVTATVTGTLVASTPITATAQMTGTWEESGAPVDGPAAPTPSPTPTPTPQIRLVLERGDGLRLLADETLLYVRASQDSASQDSASQLLAVLGNSEQAISAAMTRLINRDFSGCLVQSDLIVCPYTPGTPGADGSASSGAAANESDGEPASAAGEDEPAAPPRPGATPGPDEPSAPPQQEAAILIVDDNAEAGADEPSEAAIYLTTLVAAGYSPDLWVAGEQGAPQGSDLFAYDLVIWSDAGYEASAIDGENLRVIGEYINQGGRLTISSRMPFFGVGPKAPSVIRDVQVTDEVPGLVRGLPDTPILLLSDTPVLSPLEENPDPGAGAVSALARGPASADAGAPVLILMSDAGFDDPKGARLLLCGISMGWLPPEISDQLIRNMADVMLAE